MALAQDTPVRPLLTEVMGFGPAESDQLVPSQRTMRSVPTAKQFVLLVHDTLVSALAYCGGWFGLATTDQLVPFQCSISVLGASGEVRADGDAEHPR